MIRNLTWNVVIGIGDENRHVGVIGHSTVGGFDFQQELRLIIRGIVVDRFEKNDRS